MIPLGDLGLFTGMSVSIGANYKNTDAITVAFEKIDKHFYMTVRTTHSTAWAVGLGASAYGVGLAARFAKDKKAEVAYTKLIPDHLKAKVVFATLFDDAKALVEDKSVAALVPKKKFVAKDIMKMEFGEKYEQTSYLSSAYGLSFGDKWLKIGYDNKDLSLLRVTFEKVIDSTTGEDAIKRTITDLYGKSQVFSLGNVAATAQYTSTRKDSYMKEDTWPLSDPKTEYELDKTFLDDKVADTGAEQASDSSQNAQSLSTQEKSKAFIVAKVFRVYNENAELQWEDKESRLDIRLHSESVMDKGTAFSKIEVFAASQKYNVNNQDHLSLPEDILIRFSWILPGKEDKTDVFGHKNDLKSERNAAIAALHAIVPCFDQGTAPFTVWPMDSAAEKLPDGPMSVEVYTVLSWRDFGEWEYDFPLLDELMSDLRAEKGQGWKALLDIIPRKLQYTVLVQSKVYDDALQALTRINHYLEHEDAIEDELTIVQFYAHLERDFTTLIAAIDLASADDLSRILDPGRAQENMEHFANGARLISFFLRGMGSLEGIEEKKHGLNDLKLSNARKVIKHKTWRPAYKNIPPTQRINYICELAISQTSDDRTLLATIDGLATFKNAMTSYRSFYSNVQKLRTVAARKVALMHLRDLFKFASETIEQFAEEFSIDPSHGTEVKHDLKAGLEHVQKQLDHLT